MSEEQLEYDPEWTLATLNDAKEALEDLIAQVEDSPENGLKSVRGCARCC